jgi:hypothetical protein
MAHFTRFPFLQTIIFKYLRTKRALVQFRLRRLIEKEFVYENNEELLDVFCLFRRNRPEIVFVYMNRLDVENDMD